MATPIGNSGDITLRALDALGGADVIACEDTRVTARLLAIHQIGTPMVPYHDHNAGRMLPALIKRLKKGEMVALVSDAGTPLISDPGYRLVRACIEDGLAVTALPGASAVLPAMVLSGLPVDRFLFAGFPPARQAARKRELESLASVPATLVFLESPRRLAASLADMAEALGPREGAVTREMTKMFEEVRRGTLTELAAHYGLAGPPRGEVTVVVAPPRPRPADTGEVDRLLTSALAGGYLARRRRPRRGRHRPAPAPGLRPRPGARAPPAMTAVRKRRAWAFGRLAEGLCAWHLRVRGYRILARRFRTTVGEIDIVARRGNTLAVVEVKARADSATAMDSLRPRQRNRIIRAAEAFIAARPVLAGMDVRFDVMVVVPWRPPDHIMDAWRP